MLIDSSEEISTVLEKKGNRQIIRLTTFKQVEILKFRINTTTSCSARVVFAFSLQNSLCFVP